MKRLNRRRLRRLIIEVMSNSGKTLPKLPNSFKNLKDVVFWQKKIMKVVNRKPETLATNSNVNIQQIVLELSLLFNDRLNPDDPPTEEQFAYLNDFAEKAIAAGVSDKAAIGKWKPLRTRAQRKAAKKQV